MARYDDKNWRESMRIRLDYNNMMSDFIGVHGISADELSAFRTDMDKAAQRLKDKRPQMKWRELPHNQGELIRSIIDAAERIRRTADDFVVLGIGGSALGPIAVQQALAPMRYNDLSRARRGGPRLFVEDNIDPERMRSLFEVINIKKTVFNVITKSGSTSETMSQFLLAVDMLKPVFGSKWAERVVATTDLNKGNLIKIARENNIETFFVPDGVGGRFSELCPVGLLAAAVCGVDIREMLAGAAYMDELINEDDRNIAYVNAALEVLAMRKGANISVMMPYADSLKYMADWYAQLWAESLGKSTNNSGNTVNCGQTPVKALGVTDQHSQVQLYTEGPFDKVITFLGVERYRDEVTIPHAFDDVKDVAFLSGHTFNELILSEQAATEYAVMKSGHAGKRITLPEVNAFTLGQLMYMFEVQTAFAGELLDLNAFDQPGVEEGKNAAYAMLGRQGYDEKRAELSKVPAKKSEYII